MLKIKALTVTLFILFFFAGNTYSQNNTYDFLRLNVGARASALGGSFVTNTNDVNGLFYNPASLSTITTSQASIGFYKYLLDINSGNLAYGQKFKDEGYFGGTVKYFNYGSFTKKDASANDLGTFNANDLAVTLGYSNAFQENFYYGANLKFIYSQIDEFNSTALAVDLGLLYVIPSTMWNFGISLLNAGTQMSQYDNTKEDLPLDLRVGVSKRLEHLPVRINFEFSDLTQSGESFWENFKNLSVGGEFDFSENVKFRIGYDNAQRQDLKTGSSIGIAGFSTGIGFNFLENYSFDYAFSSMGNVGTNNRIDVGFKLK
ncbi:MAG TPA: type IX secretion system protein PorQ [Ignavibacteria bacterium]|nr:type IX secretion system protein PorQ [Ignavibacteria bacterium]HQY52176.1 type IX secretion system protein PorQ [Ignavibacteria bacterium]HRB01301.1 type IX secretion system protein PorQ [Ignavibacteria bacterium]